MTAIWATIGPRTDNDRAIAECLQAGVDAFRFSGSKFTGEVLKEQAARVAAIASDMGVRVDLLLDLPGSKARLTNDGGFELTGLVELDILFGPAPASRSGERGILGLTGADLKPLVTVGDILVIGDGEDALEVTSIAIDRFTARPLTYGTLGRSRGVTIEGKSVRHDSLTSRDSELLAATSNGAFTGVIQSFVESPDQLAEARNLIRESSEQPRALVAKIETPAGIACAEQIARFSDVVLIGRGDLLLTTGPIAFHAAQQQAIDACRNAGVPFVVGTDLLPSLSGRWLPNRSELSFLCSLLESGVDGLLLAMETTIGESPQRTIAMIDNLRRRYARSSVRQIISRRLESNLASS